MKKLGNRIQRILTVDGESFSVTLRFSDGAVGVVSLVHLFERPKGLAAEILKGGHVFDVLPRKRRPRLAQRF